MAIPSSLTANYDALLSTTLYNYQASGGLKDQISTSNAFLYTLMTKRKEGYVTKNSIGYKAQIPLMYAVNSFDSYDGYDQLDVSPFDGITSAFFDWRQASTPIAISGKEEKMNKGPEQLIDLLDSKIKQAEIGIKEGIAKAMLQGAGGSSITTAYTSPANGSSFVDPLPTLVYYDSTQAATVGNIAQGTYSWWQNKYSQSSASTFAGLFKELDHLYNNCSKGPGGPPDFHLTEQQTFELYQAALRSKMQFIEYSKADIPFENVLYRGQPLVWDEFMPDAYSGSTTITYGTWYMLNLQFFQIQVEGSTDFVTTPFIKPENQDAKVAHVMWMGAMLCSNRRKQGVLQHITLSTAS